MPEIAMEAFEIVKTGPDEALRLQSSTVNPRKPVILKNGTLPLTAMLDSLKTPAESNTTLAFLD